MQKLAVYISLLLVLALHNAQAVAEQSSELTAPEAATPIEAKTTNLAWQYRGEIDYEQDSPGYGKGYQFISWVGRAFIDVYRYDLGKENWLEGIADPDLIKVLDIAKNEIYHQLQKGAYVQANFSELRQSTIADQDFYIQPVYLETPQHPMTSFIYLTVLNKRLLKFRISYISPPSSYDIEQINNNFIEEAVNGLKQQETPKPKGLVL